MNVDYQNASKALLIFISIIVIAVAFEYLIDFAMTKYHDKKIRKLNGDKDNEKQNKSN